MNMDLTFKLKVLNLDLPKNFLACNSQMNSWLDFCVRAPFGFLTKNCLFLYLDLQALCNPVKNTCFDIYFALKNPKAILNC